MDSAIRFDVATIPLDNNLFGVVTIMGNPKSKVQQLRDYELGYRAQAAKRLSIDIATFRSYYRNLSTIDPGIPYFTTTPGPPHLVIPLYLGNGGRARNYGAELFANWDVTNWWRVSPGVSLLQMNMLEPASQDSTLQGVTGDTPQRQVDVRSFMKLRRNLDWNTSVYFVGRLATAGIPAYTRVDTRLGWRIEEAIELSLVGQNLLTPRHATPR